ncbi:MAG TPA: hypothetical protein VD993_19025 [Chitinophagaceae bacterium]|nr:hypothetical protein [Chitinophagaceae bacterium]
MEKIKKLGIKKIPVDKTKSLAFHVGGGCVYLVAEDGHWKKICDGPPPR